MGPEKLHLYQFLGTMVLLVWDLTLRASTLENAHFEDHGHTSLSFPPTPFLPTFPPFLVSFFPGPTFSIRVQNLGWADQMAVGCREPQACGVTGCGGVRVSQVAGRGKIPCSRPRARAAFQAL